MANRWEDSIDGEYLPLSREARIWVAIAFLAVCAVFVSFGLMWANGALTAENMRLIFGGIVGFLVALFVVDTIIRPIIIEPIAAVMQLRPRQHPKA